ncbi:MAG: hypothetical protein QOK07_297 [Gemmatimonadaceae bacterium]|nr:hypothetical protein [Gemmatimonadaceae bacterium]
MSSNDSTSRSVKTASSINDASLSQADPVRREVPITVLIAVSALAIMAVGGVIALRSLSSDDAFDVLEKAVQHAEYRPVRAPLSGAFPYRPYQQVHRGSRAIELPSPSDLGNDLHALGVLHLMHGDADRSINLLERCRATTEQPSVFSDLAAAFYERASNGGPSSDFAASFSGASQALAAQPGFLPALYTRALALESLYAREDAADAWRDYLTVDTGSPWAIEARQHLARMVQPVVSADITAALEKALASDDYARLSSLVAGSPPQYARALTEESLLGTWANAVNGGDARQIEQATRRLGAMVSALSKSSRDGMATDSALPVLQGRPDRRTLAAAYASYSAARAGFAKARDAHTRDECYSAARLLEVAHSPLAARAWISGATIDHYLGNSDVAREILKRTREQLSRSDRPYPLAKGEASWMLGLIEQARSRSQDALRHYEEAALELERAGEASHLAGISSVLSETYRYLGDFENAWKSQRSALRYADSGGTYSRKQAVLNDAALLSIATRHFALADTLVRRVIRTAEGKHDPAFLALGSLSASRSLLAQGRVSEARRFADRAAAEFARRTPDGSTVRLMADIALVRGEILTRVDPRAAAEVLTDASERFRHLHQRSRLAQLYLQTARAWRGVNDLSRAEAALKAGLLEVEEQRFRLGDDLERSTFTDTARALFDDSVELLIMRNGEVEALDVVRRARTLGITDPGNIAGDYDSHPVASSRDTTLIEYYILPGELLSWTTSDGTTTLTRRRIRSADLSRLIGRDTDAISKCDELATCKRESSELYELLIRPVGAIGRGDLIIAPDGILHVVPFAALYDAEASQFLAERDAVAIVLSATPPPAQKIPRDIFIAMAPFSTSPGLPALGAAALEAESAARYFSDTSIVSDTRTTAGRFLKEWGRHDAVHFAGHASWNASNALQSALHFAPDSDHPSGDLHPGELRRPASGRTQLVVLAACDSGRGPLTNAGTLSFARSFAAAGVPHVVATLWPLADRESAVFFDDFYASLTGGHSVYRAMNDAQRRAIQSQLGPGSWGGLQLYVSKPMTIRKGPRS